MAVSEKFLSFFLEADPEKASRTLLVADSLVTSPTQSLGSVCAVGPSTLVLEAS